MGSCAATCASNLPSTAARHGCTPLQGTLAQGWPCLARQFLARETHAAPAPIQPGRATVHRDDHYQYMSMQRVCLLDFIQIHT